METLVAILTMLPHVDAFHIPSSSMGTSRTIQNSYYRTFYATKYSPNHRIRRLFAGDDDMDIGPGMEDAFKELEALKSLGDSNLPEEPRKEKDEAFAKAMEGLDLKDILSQVDDEGAKSDVSPESELGLYKDMASELDVAASEEELIAADFKTDLEMADTDGDGVPAIDTKKLMDKAINEALVEAKEQDSNVDVDDAKEAFLDNKEIMSEIEKIFDKANDELLEELEEIREEQATLAKQQAERNSKANLEKIAEDEKRMEVAQGNMKRMLDKVNKETKAVEEAMEELKKAQAASEGGIEGQLSDLRSGGLVKQAALAGGLLFTLRSGVETIAFLAGDPSHVLPALVQGALAIACIVAFIFL